jgi:hypothetical protein
MALCQEEILLSPCRRVSSQSDLRSPAAELQRAPTHNVTVVFDDGALILSSMRWGLVPWWAKIGTRIREAKLQLEAAGLKVEAYDHEVSKSIYFSDPDGNTIELHIDASDCLEAAAGGRGPGDPT